MVFGVFGEKQLKKRLTYLKCTSLNLSVFVKRTLDKYMYYLGQIQKKKRRNSVFRPSFTCLSSNALFDLFLIWCSVKFQPYFLKNI